MGIHTDFFLADDEQLAHVFAGWLTVANEPVLREATNPFTGQTQSVKDWPPGKPVSEGEPSNSPELADLPHVRLKSVEHVKIAALTNILTGTPVKDAIDIFVKPALVHPTSDDIGLHELPNQLTAALRPLPDDAVDAAANKWQRTDEMQSDQFTFGDCKDVLHLLRGLAQSCKPPQRMYLLWSL